MNPKIVCVAAYEEMRLIAQGIAFERKLPIDFVVGELYEAVEQLREKNLPQREVIIARGGTARLIADNFPVHVVEIVVSPFDILRSIYPFVGKKIAVIGSGNIIDGAKVLRKIMNIELLFFSVTFENEIEDKIILAKKLHVDVVVGDTVAVRIAKKHGLENKLIVSGEEAVAEAITKAQQICEVIAAEKEKSSRLNAMIENLNTAIVVVDEKARIDFCNSTAEKMFGVNKNMIIGRDCEEVLPIIGIAKVIATGEASTKHIVKLSDNYIAMNKIPVWVEGEVKGAVITCQDITQIQETEEKIRQTLGKRGLTAKNSFGDIIGRSTAITEAIHLAKKYGETNLTVLIHGESGTGKELFAQSIHNVSKMHMGPFVALNCATIPKDLLESTLFGYEDGSFTGATKGGKKGLFELANNGTLFLDEITEMDISTQANFLRVLQEKEIMRIGGDRVVPVSVRIVCASNKSLKTQVERGLFREDLFYRLNVLALEIPPLRDRKGDIPLLTEHFSKKYSESFGKGKVYFPDDVIKLLDGYGWPGNIRQLENVIQKIVIVSDRGEAEMKYIQPDIFSMDNAEAAEPDDLLEGDLEAITRKIVLEVLRRESYNKTQTAKRLGITRSTLNSKIS